MAYTPDMGGPAPAPSWFGGHSSIEQPGGNPFMEQQSQIPPQLLLALRMAMQSGLLQHLGIGGTGSGLLPHLGVGVASGPGPGGQMPMEGYGMGGRMPMEGIGMHPVGGGPQRAQAPGGLRGLPMRYPGLGGHRASGGVEQRLQFPNKLGGRGERHPNY